MVSGCCKPFQTYEDEENIGKTYWVTLHTHPTPKYLEGCVLLGLLPEMPGAV